MLINEFQSNQNKFQLNTDLNKNQSKKATDQNFQSFHGYCPPLWRFIKMLFGEDVNQNTNNDEKDKKELKNLSDKFNKSPKY